jgi:hypothetical protein
MPFHSLEEAAQVLGPFSQPGAYSAFCAATGGVVGVGAVVRYIERQKAKRTS